MFVQGLLLGRYEVSESVGYIIELSVIFGNFQTQPIQHNVGIISNQTAFNCFLWHNFFYKNHPYYPVHLLPPWRVTAATTTRITSSEAGERPLVYWHSLEEIRPSPLDLMIAQMTRTRSKPIASASRVSRNFFRPYPCSSITCNLWSNV
jgi:hypothetical protein